MKAHPILPHPAVPIRGILRGPGREAPCELLLEWKPVSAAEVLAGTRRTRLEWTILRAPLNLPDGEYTVTSGDGRHFRATRRDGFWIHGNAAIATSWPGFAASFRRVAAKILQFDNRYGISLLLLGALITYVLPTALELMAARDAHLGIAVLLFGDLIGCVCLTTFLRMPVAGVALYLLLTVIEGWLYLRGVLTMSHLAWLTDLVPMIVVAIKIVRLRSAAHPPSSERLPS
ncbi:MAG: hypothetical protein WA294_13025 [Acidobacteriaceae bacterium]